MFQIILRVLSLLKQRKLMVFSLTLANLIFAILVLIEPIFFKEVIDILIAFEDTEINNYQSLFYTLILWVVVWIVTILVRLYVSIYSDRLSHEEFNNNVRGFFSRVMNLSMRFHMDANSWQLVKKVTKGTDGMFEVRLNIFRRMIPSIFTIFIMIPIVLYFNWKLGSFVIVIWVFSAALTIYLSIKTFKKQDSIEPIYSEMSSHYGDTFTNIPIIKSFTLGGMKKSELENLTDLRLRKQYPVLMWWGFIISLSQILRIIVSIWVISFGSYLFILWEISVGEIVMFLSFSTIFLSAIEDITWTIEGIFWRLAGIREYFEILDTRLEVQDAPNSSSLSKAQWRVTFQDMTFSYDGKRKVLQNIDIDIKIGEKVAFVGHTGSWKTTMTNLLLRFFDPQEGAVLIDGQDISKITQDSLRKNIWVVFQDNSLFNTTIENNIRLDNDTATRADIERVADKSHASDFISNLSDWLDTVVGERGVKLSWGEKQRLAIARAFLKDAPILVLDEATSALDAETERYLQASFDELMKGRTTFIIAHRLSTIKKADRIFVFDWGRIIEQGSYKDLVAKKWSFAKLVAAQVEGFIE